MSQVILFDVDISPVTFLYNLVEPVIIDKLNPLELLLSQVKNLKELTD